MKSDYYDVAVNLGMTSRLSLHVHLRSAQDQALQVERETPVWWPV